MNVDKRKKEDLESELVEAENDIAMDSNLQGKKEVAEMFERMVSPEYQQERELQNIRKRFVKKNITKVGL